MKSNTGFVLLFIFIFSLLSTTLFADSPNNPSIGEKMILDTPITKDKCVSVIPEHNNLDENRVNIIFININKDKNSFLNSVLASIDYTGEGDGLLSIEPFKSNKDKFNFFYVDQVGESSPQEKEINSLISQCDSLIIKGGILPILFIDSDLGINIDTGSLYTKKEGFGRISIYYNSKPNINPKIVVHEFGHAFGGLLDEESRGIVYLRDEESGRLVNFQDEVHGRNLYVSDLVDCQTTIIQEKGKQKDVTECIVTPESIADCEVNSGWGDLIGDGCGKKGVVDCTFETVNISEEVCGYEGDEIFCHESIRPVLKNPKANIEVRCDILADEHAPVLISVSQSIMISSTSYFSFGPYNERLLCEVIKDNTGSAGGVCEKLLNQKEADASCNNNFECSTNLCIDSQCVRGGLWQKFLEWIKRIFG